MNKLFHLFLIIAFPQITNCQNLNGNWIGWSEKKITVGTPQSIKLELEQLTDTTFTGVLHLQYTKGKFEHTKISGFLNKKDSSFSLIEDSLISYNLGFFESVCLGKTKLKTRFTDTSIIMYGLWKDKSRALLRCPNLKMQYEKKLNNKITVTPNIRFNDVQKVIDLSRKYADSVRLELYDGGEVDNDSVNVILNDVSVLKNIRLNITPTNYYLNLNKNLEINKLTMQAINLGDIEPNTAFLVIIINKKRYAITLSSSFKKNGVVEFQFVD